MTMTELLDRLENVKGRDGQYTARCPAHDDRRNSLSVSESRDGKILLHCHAGCETEDVLRAMGLTMKDLSRGSAPQPGEGRRPAEKGKATDEYLYCDANGEVVLKKTRLTFPDGKSFYWQHFDGYKWQPGRNGIIPPLYNQNAMADDGQIFVVEGEKDVKTMNGFRFTAVSLPDGAGSKWREEYGPLFREKEVYIIPDHDSAGERYALQLEEKIWRYAKNVRILDLSLVWHDMPDKADVTDFYEKFGFDRTVLTIADLATNTPAYDPAQRKCRFCAKSAEDFGEDLTRFVWHPFVPVGDYTVLMAEGGSGKTMLCCAVAATLSRGELRPGDSVNDTAPKGNILFISAEDKGEVLKHRLVETDAVLSRIRILDCVDSEGLNFDDGFEDFRNLILQAKPALVIVDPWHAFLGSRVDINRVNALRPVLQKLSNLAKEAECGMILISHVNKRSQGENANNAATGSVDFTNASRSVIRVIRDDEPGHQDHRIMVHTKSNYAREGRSVVYCITDGGGVRWAGFSEINRSLLEEAARCRKTPGELIESRVRAAEEEDTLADAIRELAVEGQTVNLSYEEVKEKYGETVFGSGQPKKLLDRLAETIYAEGITIVTGKNVKYNGKTRNGFSLTKKDVFGQEGKDDAA